ncbi:hypothetical protein TSAR_015389 [Trichomalopsis sarcophagae]|uniref:Ionotropic glutamate receptor C-terminal domain-containing protein n=1 Tax=Trichomalopsis sarcophagae TaxID=543379 RepID=A0A232FAP0_9HYME|nr:hypothetical protein TSAR_015389 [Trichomalopsis sarcophagae]
MKIRYYLLVLAFLTIQELQGNPLASIGGERGKLDFLAIKIAEDISDDYGALIFTPDHPKPLPFYSIFVERILQKSPSMVTKVSHIVNCTLTNLDNNYRKYGAITYIVLYQVENSTEELMLKERYTTKRFIDQVAKTFIFPHEIDRLKCLLVIFDKENNSKVIKEQVIHAWEDVQMLDISVINIIINNGNFSLEYTLHYFMPFENYHIQTIIRPDTIIFPNKLVDANGYPFKIKIAEYMKLDDNGMPKNTRIDEQIAVSFINMALKKLNLTSKFTEDPISVSTPAFTVALTLTNMLWRRNDLLKFDKMIDRDQLFLERKRSSDRYTERLTRLHCFHEHRKIVAVVSVRTDLNLQYPYTLFVYSGIIFTIVCVIACVRKLFSNNDRFWRSFNIFELLTGVSIEVQPRQLIDKIFFMCFALISMVYVADFYSDVLGIKYIRQIVKFDTFKQLYDYNFDIYINSSYKIKAKFFDPTRSYYTDVYAQKILAESEPVSKIGRCLKKLRKNHRVMCISSATEFYDELDEDMEIAKPVFYYEYSFYTMMTLSPYHRELQRIVDRIFETGIGEYLKRPKNIHDYALQDSELRMTTKILVIVITGGCTIAILTFIAEVLAAFYRRQNNFRIDVL